MLGGKRGNRVVDVTEEFVDKLGNRIARAVEPLGHGGECLLAENCAGITGEEPRASEVAASHCSNRLCSRRLDAFVRERIGDDVVGEW